jgi:hypothetical protein
MYVELSPLDNGKYSSRSSLHLRYNEEVKLNRLKLYNELIRDSPIFVPRELSLDAMLCYAMM